MTSPSRGPVSWSFRTLFCLVLVILLVLIVIAGRVLPLDPFAVDLAHIWEGPTVAHPCGRDGLGRDLLARLLIGTGTSFEIVASALVLALVLGVVFGGISGWYGGWIDALIMRIIDFSMGIRELVLAIIVSIIMGPSKATLVVILGLGCSPPLIRFVRSLALVQRGQTHVLAAMALGASPFRIVITHILPNIGGSIAVRAASIVGPLVQTEVALSFLGIGVQDPAPSLGTLVRDALFGLQSGFHLIVAITVTIFLIAFTSTLMADEARDITDPRWGGRSFGESPKI